MLRLLYAIGLVLSLALSAAVAQQSTTGATPEVLRGVTVQPVAPPTGTSAASADTQCQDNSVPVSIDGKEIMAVARVCPQPDGSWRVTQETPGMPSQLYINPGPSNPCGPGAQQPCAAGQTQALNPAPAAPDSAGIQPTCRDYTVPVIIDGRTVQATGLACLQPDGSWRVTQETPGLPMQTYTVPPPPPYPAYPEGSPNPYAYAYPYGYPYWTYDPWFYGPPYWFGGFVFVNRFDHFHRFHHFHRHEEFHGGGMHHRH